MFKEARSHDNVEAKSEIETQFRSRKLPLTRKIYAFYHAPIVKFWSNTVCRITQTHMHIYTSTQSTSSWLLRNVGALGKRMLLPGSSRLTDCFCFENEITCLIFMVEMWWNCKHKWATRDFIAILFLSVWNSLKGVVKDLLTGYVVNLQECLWSDAKPPAVIDGPSTNITDRRRGQSLLVSSAHTQSGGTLRMDTKLSYAMYFSIERADGCSHIPTLRERGYTVHNPQHTSSEAKYFLSSPLISFPECHSNVTFWQAKTPFPPFFFLIPIFFQCGEGPYFVCALWNLIESIHNWEATEEPFPSPCASTPTGSGVRMNLRSMAHIFI